jgi:hypothetical protein
MAVELRAGRGYPKYVLAEAERIAMATYIYEYGDQGRRCA